MIVIKVKVDLWAPVLALACGPWLFLVYAKDVLQNRSFNGLQYSISPLPSLMYVLLGMVLWCLLNVSLY